MTLTKQLNDNDRLKWHTPETVWVVLRSWRGISLGAIHYYGSLNLSTNHDCKVDLIRVLTVSGARELTKLQNDNSLFGNKFTWRVGDETKCFDNEDDVIAAALSCYRKHFPKAKRLVLGDPIYCEPEKILAGKKP
jgi:hypothetical protein